jgi:hypothetical protein
MQKSALVPPLALLCAGGALGAPNRTFTFASQKANLESIAGQKIWTNLESMSGHARILGRLAVLEGAAGSPPFQEELMLMHIRYFNLILLHVQKQWGLAGMLLYPWEWG